GSFNCLATASASDLFCPAGSATKLTTQVAPCSPNALIISAPIPRELPVTRTTFPEKSNGLFMTSGVSAHNQRSRQTDQTNVYSDCERIIAPSMPECWKYMRQHDPIHNK